MRGSSGSGLEGAQVRAESQNSIKCGAVACPIREDTDLEDSQQLCATTSDTQVDNCCQNVFPKYILQ